MRNLKRALSLGLTAAMISGLMVMGSSAASYADVTSEDNVEAIEVLQAVGIMVGDENGDFNPDQNVTRNEMAVVMSNLMEYNVATYKNTSPFTDVPSWAEPYVAACYTNGITAGTSATTYGGSDTVTTAQAALMLMKALGYFQYNSDFGSDWQLATVRQGNAIDLFDGVDSGVTDSMTRNDVAQLVLNTLEAGTVQASTDANWTIGNVTIASNVEYSYITSNSGYAESIHSVKSTSNTTDANRYVVELGEQLYQGDLRLREGTTDDFGRPSRTWSYKNSEIGTYASDPDVTYSAKVEAGDVYKDLGLGKNVDKSDVTVYVDGLEDEDLSIAIRKNSDTKVGESGNGVLTEVYYDEDNNDILVVQVNTYVATVVRTVAATDKRDAYVIISPEAPLSGSAPISGNEEFETDQKFDDDAYVLYTYSKAVDEIESVELAEQITGTVTRAENDNTNIADAKALTIDGTRYKDSVYVAGEKLGDISVDEEYTIYLDSYGYMIYVEENDEIGDYALLYDVADRGSFVGKKAELVFTDGTMKVVDTDENYTQVDNLKLDLDRDGDIDNYDQAAFYDSGVLKTPVIVTYRVDKDGVYSLRAVDTDKASYTKNSDDLVLTNDKAGIKANDFGLNTSPSATTTVNANSATVFVVADPGSDEDYTAYVGIKNSPSITTVGGSGSANTADVYYYCKSGKMTTVMFILPGANVEVEDDSNNTIYLARESVSNLIHDRDGDYYEFQAVVNDKVETVKIDENVKIDGTAVTGSDAKLLNGIFKSYSTDKYGVITGLKTFDGNDADSVGDGVDRILDSKGNTVRIQPKETFYDTDSKVYVSDTGIARVSKEYTILTDFISTDNYRKTITVNEDADIFYVDEDGKISVSSYNAISIDNNDKVYAVVSDYMVQTLVIEEVKAPTDTYSAAITVDGAANDGTKVTVSSISAVERGDSMSFTVTPKEGITVKAVTANGKTLTAVSGVYTITNVTRNQTINIITEGTAVNYYNITVALKQGARVTIDGKPVAAGKVSLTAGEHTVVATYPSTAPEAGKAVAFNGTYLPEYGDNTYYITVSANTDTLVVGVETHTLDLTNAGNLTANWTLGTLSGSVEKGTTADVPVDANVTLAGVDFGNYDKNGNAVVKAFEMAGNKAITEDDYGYVALTVNPEVTITSGDSGTGSKVRISAEMEPSYVKVNTTATAEITLKVTSVGDSNSLTSAKAVSVNEGSTTAQVPNGSYTSTATPVTVNVTGISVATGNIELTVTVA